MRTAVEAATSNWAATARRDLPPEIPFTIRNRKSDETALPMAPPPANGESLFDQKKETSIQTSRPML
ncbi:MULTISPECIES: hypothetical protein [unclassified Mesorhizobium]|uniref:hypothetical protein n=1 Tax=unclassified Mesorhizobium TaxID=325217 RepID=UPI003339FD5B